MSITHIPDLAVRVEFSVCSVIYKISTTTDVDQGPFLNTISLLQTGHNSSAQCRVKGRSSIDHEFMLSGKVSDRRSVFESPVNDFISFHDIFEIGVCLGIAEIHGERPVRVRFFQLSGE